MTISDLATGAGTLVLAVATFASVRSANRSARTAEESMRAGMRPVLMNSRMQDPAQKVRFGDGVWVRVAGGSAAITSDDSVVYLVLSVRNAGTGMAIIHGWRVFTGLERPPRCPPLNEFTDQTRDMYVAPNDVGFWQGALRQPDTERFKAVRAAIEAGDPLTVDVLYGDFEGGQRVISRFTTYPSPFTLREDDDQPRPSDPAPGRLHHEDDSYHGEDLVRARAWVANVVRHWNVDRPDPR